ncbi:MAG: hypothetical protein FWG80_01925 [Alphaproteobacteria bacterium]|nr:hypothetical protein [Alphaproteobacteria bacterium]
MMKSTSIKLFGYENIGQSKVKNEPFKLWIAKAGMIVRPKPAEIYTHTHM